MRSRASNPLTPLPLDPFCSPSDTSHSHSRLSRKEVTSVPLTRYIRIIRSHPASEVYVTGTFDNWSKSAKLENENGVFKKRVELPSAEKAIAYKFVVDDKWVNDHTKPTETDSEGNVNNILKPEEIETSSSAGTQHGSSGIAGALMSGATPNSSTAERAGQAPLEGDKSATSDSLPGTWPPETPQEESKGFMEEPFSSPDSVSHPLELFPGDIVPDYSTYLSATVNSGSSNAESLKKSAGNGAQSFGVSPLPATGGHGNPVQVKPGESLPASDSYTSNTTDSHVKLDKDSYEKSDAYPSKNATMDTQEGAFGVPPVSAGMIPESSLPMGPNTSTGERDAGPVIQSAGADSSTAALAGNVPIEPRGVPEVVKDSQNTAQESPEASSSTEAVKEKSAVEQELKEKIPETKPTSEESPSPKASGGLMGGIGLPASITNAISSMNFGRGASPPAEPAGDKSREITDTVPEVVKDAQNTSSTEAEASANPDAVTDKSAMEKELMSKVAKTDSGGEPAPPSSDAKDQVPVEAQKFSTTAEGVTGGETTIGSAGAAAAVAERATGGAVPLDSSESSALPKDQSTTSSGLNAPADKPAQSIATETGQVASEATPTKAADSTESRDKENTKTEKLAAPAKTPERVRDESRDVSPMSKPIVTSGIDSKTAGDSKPVATGWKTTPTKETEASASSTPATGNSSSPATKEEKKKNRRSFFGKIKDKLK